MSLLAAYFKEKVKYYILYISILIVMLVTILLFEKNIVVFIYPSLISLAVLVVFTVVDFFSWKRRHQAITHCLGNIDNIANDLPKTKDYIETDYQKVILTLSDMLREEELLHDLQYRETLDYCGLWVHQIKTPITSMRLCLSRQDNKDARLLYSKLFDIEHYVSMIHAYIRLGSTYNDYVIKEYDLDKIIKMAIKQFSSDFINKKIKLNYESVPVTVVTDSKWLSFVIEQLLSNALKYTAEGGQISIKMSSDTQLQIKDTGIGIASEDIPRICELGYTGYNGRKHKQASGIGLYLCQSVCDKLGINMMFSSELAKGTSVTLAFSSKKATEF